MKEAELNEIMVNATDKLKRCVAYIKKLETQVERLKNWIIEDAQTWEPQPLEEDEAKALVQRIIEGKVR